jgi:hypothetical protein
MRLLTNENIPESAVGALRDRGHDVLAVKESMCGAADQVILARAQSESRLVVTQDKDFGELAFPSACRLSVALFSFDWRATTRTLTFAAWSKSSIVVSIGPGNSPWQPMTEFECDHCHRRDKSRRQLQAATSGPLP